MRTSRLFNSILHSLIKIELKHVMLLWNSSVLYSCSWQTLHSLSTEHHREPFSFPEQRVFIIVQSNLLSISRSYEQKRCLAFFLSPCSLSCTSHTQPLPCARKTLYAASLVQVRNIWHQTRARAAIVGALWSERTLMTVGRLRLRHWRLIDYMRESGSMSYLLFLRWTMI